MGGYGSGRWKVRPIKPVEHVRPSPPLPRTEKEIANLTEAIFKGITLYSPWIFSHAQDGTINESKEYIKKLIQQFLR